MLTKTAKSYKELAFATLVEIFQTRGDLLDSISTILNPHSDAIANAFYDALLSVEESRVFLSGDLVNTRLRASMSAWIQDLFTPRAAEDVESFIDRQTVVGEVHARINVPMHLVNLGMQVLKREVGRILSDTGLSEREKLDAVMVSGALLDNAVALINEVYLLQITENERASEALRIQSAGAHLAAECERLKAGLLDWLRQFLVAMVEGNPSSSVVDFRQSDFGMWLAYRADVFFPENRRVIDLKKLTDRIQEYVDQLAARNWETGSTDFLSAMSEINSTVTSAVWLLSNLAEDNLRIEDGRDSLTRLFGRRHLPPVIQRQIELSRSRDLPFSLLLLDVDRFKQINDRYGHQVGDAVLRNLALLITRHIRAIDFVFRYGGEEFLIMLGNTRLAEAEKVADHLCAAVRKNGFDVAGHDLQITVSIGVATYFGHPDYHTLIDKADKAMFAAKKAGRDCWRSVPMPSA